MLIKIGNIFESSAITIVNTINCVGVMGKGIALEFKKRYPEMYKEYVSLCNNGEIKPGKPYYYYDLNGASIINFPTKDHWRSSSKLSYIVSGLDWFRKNYESLGIESIAFPPLGCGNGGLSWDLVGPIMYYYLNDLPIDIEIYAPYGTSSEKLTDEYLKKNLILSSSEVIGNKNVKFNKYWYLLLYITQKLNAEKYSLNVGRVIFQKICYVLTRTGIPTGFNFVEGAYGPYAPEVNEAITVLANANLIIERRLGKMIETVVSPLFKLNYDSFTYEELDCAERTIDLLSRIKSTDQAEMLATVMFSYDELIKNGVNDITDSHILAHVLRWKPHWENKKTEILDTITSLSMLEWINPYHTIENGINDDHLY